LISENKLYLKAKSKDKNITHALVKEFLSLQETNQLHQKVKLSKHYIPIISKFLFEIVQMDLLALSNLSATNDNFKFI